jgi:hypothetical protein
MVDKTTREILDAARSATADGLGIVEKIRADHGLADRTGDGPRMLAWKQRDLTIAPLPSPLSAALIEMIKVCIVESERTGRFVTAGLALRRLQEHCEAYDVSELPPDEQDWQSVAAKYVPLSAARIAELIDRVSSSGGRLLRCAGCGAGLHSRCACGAPYSSDARPPVEAPPLAPAKTETFGRALAAVTAHPEKSDRALAAEIGCDHKTIGKARRSMDAAVGVSPPDSPPDRRAGRDGRSYPGHRQTPNLINE